MQGKRGDESENNFVSNRCKSVIIVDSWFLRMSFCHQATFEAIDSSVFVFLALYIQPQRIAFLPGGKSTRVQVWLLIKLESSSRIESIHASDLLASANPWGSPSLSRVFVTVAASPSSWSWSILAWVRSAVDRLSPGPWGEARESSSLAGIGYKELECVGLPLGKTKFIRFLNPASVSHLEEGVNEKNPKTSIITLQR